MSDGVRVGVLSLHNSKETKAICNAIAALGHDPEWLRAENLTLRAAEDAPVIDPPVDIVINRLLVPSAARPLTALGLLSAIEAEVPVVNPSSAVATAAHKFAAATHLTDAELPVPPAALRIGAQRQSDLWPPGESDREPVESLSGTAGSRVFKYPIGTHGDATELLGDGDDVPQRQPETQGLIQSPVETPGDGHEDVRIYVVGDEALGAMRRHAADGDWRTNVARGGRVRDATPTLPDRAFQVAREATAELGLDVAGVDLIEGAGGWRILEVNVTAGFKGFFSATGISPAPHVAALAIERVGGTVDPDAVAALSEELDDSVPACKPPLDAAPDPAETTIGYTETVRVAGKHGSERVVAKADTGATRTSVDIGLAGEIGAGPILDHRSVKGSDDGSPRPIVPVDVRIGDDVHEVAANVRDRSHLDHDVLLGRDILERYSVRVDSRHDNEVPTAGWDPTEE